MSDKTFTVIDGKSAVAKVEDLTHWGDLDTWKLISKASSDEEGWMKSTKAMAIDGVGVVIQVTTQQDDNVAEALTFVPFAAIVDVYDVDGKLTGRRISMMESGDIVLN